MRGGVVLLAGLLLACVLMAGAVSAEEMTTDNFIEWRSWRRCRHS